MRVEPVHWPFYAVLGWRAQQVRVRVEPLEAQGGAGVGAGAEGESRVKTHDDRVRILDTFVVGTDPQALAETHGVKVFQPFALPEAIGNGLCVNRCGRKPEA